MLRTYDVIDKSGKVHDQSWLNKITQMYIMFGTTQSWKREFTVNDFIIFSNELELIMTNAIKNDIKMGTSTKGYMTGFSGFAEVVRKMKSKLKKEIYIGDKVSVTVDIKYNQSIAVQMEPGLVGVINRTQEPILYLMEAFGITEHSQYCRLITSIINFYRCYKNSNRGILTLFPSISIIGTKLIQSMKDKQYSDWQILLQTLTLCASPQRVSRMKNQSRLITR